ncbi:glycine zipper 2TM domain-containing protein [Vibrio caribbeanicus]|uniref:Glycine zipper 2TM domain-containing protein n=1 Tax=Vibrio caribbeanicus ATCC BAA-2122 TaxID=796620 RepID=E3BQ29_9VIBR|nr:glycine zipper 2TM domain-containing protein [Vibrio caribbeanicus]EFP94834.1 hypothetical protein VIBC2010_16839 [Vibrio caribbeanicus ATCC BAA-2122]
MKKLLFALSGATAVILSGCAATGEDHRADTYTAEQVNTSIEAKTVNIIAILPAKVAVDNSENVKNAQVAGGLIGAITGGVLGNQSNSEYGSEVGGIAGGVAGVAIGSTVENTTMIDGVQLTYRQEVIEQVADVKDGKKVLEYVKHDKTFISAQVGKSCEYKNGIALLVTTVKGNTRIQPNSTCPEPVKS